MNGADQWKSGVEVTGSRAVGFSQFGSKARTAQESGKSNAIIPFPSSCPKPTAHQLVEDEKYCAVSNGEIRQQLAKIVGSPGFVRATRMARFLTFIVEETLAGRAGQLCEYSVGLSVFDRKESFEPGLDPIVRNDARRLRNKLLEYYQQERNPRHVSVKIEVPKGCYVPVFSRETASPVGDGDHASYRLSVSLVRTCDGVEVISHTCDLESEPHFLQVELGATAGHPQRRPASSGSDGSAVLALSPSHFTTLRSSTQIE